MHPFFIKPNIFNFLTYRVVPKYYKHVCTNYIHQSAIVREIANKKNNTLNDYDNPNPEEKIIFNSIVKTSSAPFISRQSELITKKPPVLSLKYFYDEHKDSVQNKDSALPEDDNEIISLPYKKHDNVTLESNDNDPLHNENTTPQINDVSFSRLKDKSPRRHKSMWMKDYNKYSEVSVNFKDEDSDDDDDSLTESFKYGTADPKVPSSSVPCGGCGAHLHCQDFAIPGYLPKEIFVGLDDAQLQAVVCQRCHFLREYNTALSVSVDPKIYPQLLSQIKGKTALVILVIDMTDFPCSIWPGILDVIGPKRPLIVVGNKIDLLQDWSPDWLKRAQEALVKQLPPEANILHVALVSARTGYGIENLITTLYNLWEYRGDVYLVGCTNVGKSTLFNALLQSDYCKTKAVDLMQRATISPWPGTTLNLLRFPIMRPEGWRLAMRMSRLRQQRAEDPQDLDKFRRFQTPQMISRIERTWSHGITDKYNDAYWDDPFAMPKLGTLKNMKSSESGLDPKDPMFAQSKWLYDTPGVITSDQIIDLLTTEELVQTLPSEPLMPRTFQLWPGQSLLLAGLGRLDFIDGPVNLKMTVLASASLPVTLCWIKDANDVYNHFLGTAAFAVPCRGEKRLRVWPGLSPAPEFTLLGSGWLESCADVVLSSAGWVAITYKKNALCQLQAWTPEARGIYVRMPPVLPQSILVKGNKYYKSQAYAPFNNYLKQQ